MNGLWLLLVATLVMLGVPWSLVGAAAVMVVSPVGGIGLVATALVWEALQRRRHTRLAQPESHFLRELASTIGAGSTLRQAVVGSTSAFVDDRVRRLCHLGVPMSQVADALKARLPVSGEELAVVVGLSETTGAGVVRSLHLLADQAHQAERLVRDRRVASAQAKFSAIVVGVVPLIASVALVGIRGVPEPGGALIVGPMVLGAALMVAGSGLVFLVAARSAQ